MREALATLGPRHSLSARRATDRPLVLEVGCGFGGAAIDFAAAHPDVDVVATDVHTPGLVALLRALDVAGPGNVFVERTDALDLLDHRIGDGGLAGVHLFFPDPWPKARHRKRRFVRPDVLDALTRVLAPGGVVRVATDAIDYADWARRHLDGHDGFVGGAAPRPWWRGFTRYEAAAVAAGRRVTDLVYVRR